MKSVILCVVLVAVLNSQDCWGKLVDNKKVVDAINLFVELYSDSNSLFDLKVKRVEKSLNDKKEELNLIMKRISNEARVLEKKSKNAKMDIKDAETSLKTAYNKFMRDVNELRETSTVDFKTKFDGIYESYKAKDSEMFNTNSEMMEDLTGYLSTLTKKKGKAKEEIDKATAQLNEMKEKITKHVDDEIKRAKDEISPPDS